MNKQYNIIGFAGRSRSGKDCICNKLIEDENTALVSMAIPLKNMCCRIMDVDFDTLNEMKDNGMPIKSKLSDDAISIISQETGISVDDVKKKANQRIIQNVRDLLQFVGTDIIRYYLPDWHVNRTFESIKELTAQGKKVVIDDVRFKNERRLIENHGGIVLYIIRPMLSNISNHPSEYELQWYNFIKSHILINSGTVDDLVSEFMEMKKYCFQGITSKRFDYENAIYNSNHMYGIQYDSYELLQFIVRNSSDVIHDKQGYPYIKIDGLSDNYDMYQQALIEIGTASSVRDYKINDPFIIENLKLYKKDEKFFSTSK